jgi:cell wall-associated NlpC family hydrolase
VIGSSKKRCALSVVLATAATVALVVAAGGLSAPSDVELKQAEADQVLAQIRQIDSELDKAIDAYNGATEQLQDLKDELRSARRHLEIAKQSNTSAQRILAERVRTLYVNGSDDGVVELLLGATSIDDLLDRLDAAKRVSSQDARILADVRSTRKEMQRLSARIEKALAEQGRVVADRAARKEEIEARLAERERLYSSIEDEIAQLEAEEAERQRRLEEEARRQAAASGAAPVSESGRAGSAGTVAPAPPARYGGVVGIAMQYLGIPYQWGGSSPSTGFDCSGFVMYVFGQVGVSLPHNSAAQYGYGVPVSMDQLQAGDLVFFDGLGHDGIYIGDGLFIHSPHTGDVVKISSLHDSWYASTFVGARRIL